MARKQLSNEVVEKRKRDHEKRQIGAIHLATVPSFSEESVSYNIFLGSDNLVYCACKAWFYCPEEIQTCKHIEQLKQEMLAYIKNRQRALAQAAEEARNVFASPSTTATAGRRRSKPTAGKRRGSAK